MQVDKSKINTLNRMIQNNEKFEDIINFVDDTVLNLCKQEKKRLQEIRKRFLERRLNERM